MKDALGDRMKSYYEDRFRVHIPRRTYVIIRIDGKAFHTYTRGLKRPFDEDLISDMDETTKFLCSNIQGAKLGYVQSDEISILITDFESITTDAWFDNNVQKMVSISASYATSKFNQLRISRKMVSDYKETMKQMGEFMKKHPDGTAVYRPDYASIVNDIKLANFDARVFVIPQREEAINYFIWRQQDATRNSISAVAQSLYSHKELNGKTTDMMQELIFQKGQNWNNYPVGQKRGRLILKNFVLVDSTKEKYDKSKDKEGWVVRSDEQGNPSKYQITRSVWTAVDPPEFTKDKDSLRNIIPSNN